jgi:hypothetical protein
MSLDLKDFRGRVTPETDCVLTAEAQSTGRDRQEIVREILHEWAVQRIHGASVLNALLRREGLQGIDGGIEGKMRERAGT